jgi:N-methylhydantoinase A
MHSIVTLQSGVGRRFHAGIRIAGGLRLLRIGVDIGGTFTDVVLAKDHEVVTAKVLTTPHSPEDAVLTAIGQVLQRISARPADVDLIVHGTTLATNAIIERKGARTAFVTTQGHRDTLEIRSEDRFDIYDLGISFPAPLVPRDLRFTVAERVDARGQVIQPLDTSALTTVGHQLAGLGVESVAVGFLHAYANARHELQAAEVLARHLPGIPISISSDVSPEIREYERFSTTCANAYVRPKIEAYLSALNLALGASGFRCPLLILLSGGGLATVETVAQHPVRLVESGPAGGAIFASEVARAYTLKSVMSFDMGGTTAKLCFLDDGHARMSRMFEAARHYRFKKGSGLPLRIPVIEMVEIGAGGGSVARIDELGRLRVGPDSAGAVPGPVSYGRGGTKPTVTDADLCLGRLDPARFAGGSISLDEARAQTAIGEAIARPLDCSMAVAASAISELAEEHMANAARVHAIEQGRDISECVIVASGGAAGLHVARLAEKLRIGRFIVPRHVGVGSAMGFLQADVSFEVVRSHLSELSVLTPHEVGDLLDAMTRQVVSVVRSAAPDAPVALKITAFLRYVGQGHEVQVELPGGSITSDLSETLLRTFESEYERLYSRRGPSSAVETVAWSVIASIERREPPGELASASPCIPRPDSMRRVASMSSPDGLDVPVFYRDSLAAGSIIHGPAIITEAETSVMVTANFTAIVDERLAIDCRRKLRAEPCKESGA